MDNLIAERARTPRYTVVEASDLIHRPANTVRRWSLGHRRTYDGRTVEDKPLITADGSREESNSLSFLNLLELKMLSKYRTEAALQAIRRALAFAADSLGAPRPLLTVEFKVRGGELFAQFAETPDGRALLANASRGGQLTIDELVRSVEQATKDIDYDADEDVSRRWWFKTHSVPMYVDVQVAGGRPITADTGVRVDAIEARHHDGYSVDDIREDTGATEREVVAVVAAAA